MSSSLLARSHPPRSCLEKCFLSTFSLSLSWDSVKYTTLLPPPSSLTRVWAGAFVSGLGRWGVIVSAR